MGNIKVHHLRELQEAEQKGEITYQRMVEALNEIALGLGDLERLMSDVKDRFTASYNDTNALLGLSFDILLIINGINKSCRTYKEDLDAVVYLNFIKRLCDERLLAYSRQLNNQ